MANNLDNSMGRERQDGSPQSDQRAWNHLKTTFDVEAWIDHYNRHLQRSVDTTHAHQATGQGICFVLAEGGEIFMHTTSDGDVLLDVLPEAQWVTPVITAATQVADPHSRIWVVPGEALTQLVLGLSALIGSSWTVCAHDFKLKKAQHNL